MRYFQFVTILLVALFFSCADLDRDNLLDPKNPHSSVQRKNLVEIFVNDSTGYPFSQYALTALDEIREMESYADNLLVLEYHVENENWNDLYEQTGCLARYHKYVPETATRGIPDAFFNGAGNRVQGASSEKVKDRYLKELAAFVDQEAHFHIVAEKTMENNEVQLAMQIARLGNQGASDLILQAIIVEDPDVGNHQLVARKILSPIVISGFDAGEVKFFSLQTSLNDDFDLTRIFVVVFLQQADSEMEIFQAEKF